MVRLILIWTTSGQDRGPGDFQVNKTAAAARVGRAGEDWRLTLTGPAGIPVLLSRAQLLELPQHTARLSIACVEGWSTGLQTWTGVRLATLAALAGAPDAARLLVESMQPPAPFASATLDPVKTPSAPRSEPIGHSTE